MILRIVIDAVTFNLIVSLNGVLRVCQETHRNDCAGDQRHHNYPKRRFLVIQNRFYTLFHADLTKGQRTRCNYAPVDTAGHKCLSIVCSLLVAKVFDDLFITGKLNVTAQQDIGKPQQRVEPMNRQQEETKGFPPMVFASNMRLLMGDNVFQILSVQFERQINSRLDDAKHKRGIYILTLEDVVLVANSSIDLSAQSPITDCCIEQKHDHSKNP